MTGPVPLHGFKSVLSQWLSDVGVDAQTFNPRQSPVFSENSFSEGRAELDALWASGAHLSWLGGPAVSAAEWPRNTAGTPLAHVATFHLGDAHAALGDPNERGWPGDVADMLPDHGYLQIFHDLETYGSEPDDGEESGWLVSWHPDDPSDSRPPLVDDDGSTNAPEPALQLGLFSPGWNIPSPLDFDGLTDHEFDVTDKAIEALHSAWVTERRPGRGITAPSRRPGCSATAPPGTVWQRRRSCRRPCR